MNENKPKQAMVHGYLINPVDRTVHAVAFPDDADTLDHMRQLIGCQLVDRYTIDAYHDCWIDDEGALLEERSAFAIFDECIDGWKVLYGTGLVLAYQGGRTMSVIMSASELLGRVLFLDGDAQTEAAAIASVTRPDKLSSFIVHTPAVNPPAIPVS